MGFFQSLLHLLGFVAPALALGLLLPLAARWALPAGGRVTRYWPQAALVAAAGTAALLAGLWFFGRDGKMASYAALVAVAALAQWLLAAGWRR
ncbi:hypothetical protein ACT80S_08300 [Ramlibacter sp. MAHUQ-53]|uniref:hypothetical protein n=1 Tax=unclassified Ramlibacter TaxID=2617605 RepID=UPI0036267103